MSSAPLPQEFQWKKAVSWALYDGGNSAFATTIMAAFMPVLYGSYWASDVEKTTTTSHLLLASTVASVLVAILAPVMGSVADRSGRKKPFLACFALLGVLASASLPFVAPEHNWLALVFFSTGMFAFLAGNVFYDALIVDAVPSENYDFTSGFGFGIGYLLGGVLLAINMLMVSKPDLFGFDGPADAALWAMFSVAIWWFIFAIPVFLFVPENRPPDTVKLATAARHGVRETLVTIAQIRKQPLILGFLIAFLIYIDGVNTLAKLGVKFGADLGMDSATLLTALLVVQFVGFPMAMFFGWLGKRIGAKNGILICAGIYAIISLSAFFLNAVWHLFAFAISVGCVQGGIQSLSRSLFASIIPPDDAGKYFGFYNLLGKFSAILGPNLIIISTFILSRTGLETGTVERLQILPLALLFIVGGGLLWRLDFRKDQAG